MTHKKIKLNQFQSLIQRMKAYHLRNLLIIKSSIIDVIIQSYDVTKL